MFWRTVRHQQVDQDGDPRDDEGAALRWPPSDEAHGHRDEDFGGDVDSAEDHLDQVDVHAELLQIHRETIVGEAGR